MKIRLNKLNKGKQYIIKFEDYDYPKDHPTYLTKYFNDDQDAETTRDINKAKVFNNYYEIVSITESLNNSWLEAFPDAVKPYSIILK